MIRVSMPLAYWVGQTLLTLFVGVAIGVLYRVSRRKQK